MKIERKDYPFVEPVNKADRTDNAPERRKPASGPQDRVEISREAKLRIELAQIQALMKEKINNPKAYALLEAQYREVKQLLQELEL